MKNKKCLGVLGLAGAALLLTGCGGNKLTCTMSDEMEGFMKIKSEMTVKFDDEWKKITEIEETQVVEITSEEITDEELESLEKDAKEECEDTEFSKCDVKMDGKKVELTRKGKPSAFGAEEEMTKEELVKELEESGYTCK